MLALDGLAQLQDDFDLFLLDQFGVLHDGQRPYPGCIAALRALRAAGKQLVVISNSGKRATYNQDRMRGMGFGPDLYDRIVTSGEVAWHVLHDELGGDPDAPRPRCFLFTSGDDRSSVAGLALDLTSEIADADLVLIAGVEAGEHPAAHYRRLLEPAARRQLPCLCTNPDKYVLGARGLTPGPGRLADLYVDLGGTVRWIGKPFPAIYEFALTHSPGVGPRRTICIGDSIEHDIAGARAAGLTSALVRSGILAAKSAAELAELAIAHDAMPDYVLPGFVM